MWAKDIGVFLFFKFSINLRSFSNKMLPLSKKQHVLGHTPPHTHFGLYLFCYFPSIQNQHCTDRSSRRDASFNLG